MVLEKLWRSPWSLEGLKPPWGNVASIYEQICKGSDLCELPGTVSGWAEGAMDGVFSHHMGPTKSEKPATEILEALRELLQHPDDANLRKLYDCVVAHRMIGTADGVVARIEAKSADYDHDRLAAVARYFATRSGQQEAVKLGIVLLGVAGGSEDTTVLMRLGTRDEFSLFAVVALGRTAAEPEQCLWALAQQVHGWGRIHAVERLAHTNDPQIQAWLLREGFRNSIMNEYLARICARAGKLHEALGASAIDQELLDGAAEIIQGLIIGGPAEGIDDYEHAGEAAEAYVNHVWSSRRLELGLRHFLAIDSLLRYLDDAKRDEAWLQRGWTVEREGEIRVLCKDVLGWETWRDQVLQGLVSSDETIFFDANRVARRMGLSTWDVHFARVQAAPTTSSSWYELLQQTQEHQIDEVLRFAESALPLVQIATGPAEELGLGPGFEPHRTLSCLLQDLNRFPGRGWRLIRTGIQSPVTRNRFMAVKALSAWPEHMWPPDAINIIRKARDIEPHAETRQNLDELLRRKIGN
jgi:hypothetical protein